MNNTYFQSYVNNLSPVIVPILSVGFGVTSATVATLLYFTMRNVRRSRGLAAEDETNRSTLAEKKTGKKPLVQSSRSERTVTAAARGPRSRSFAPGSNLSKRSGAHESRDEEDESE